MIELIRRKQTFILTVFTSNYNKWYRSQTKHRFELIFPFKALKIRRFTTRTP